MEKNLGQHFRENANIWFASYMQTEPDSVVADEALSTFLLNAGRLLYSRIFFHRITESIFLKQKRS